METAIGFVHKDDAPFEQAGSKRKKKGKNGKDERQVKRSLARRFKIDMDILELTVQNQMVDRLRAEAIMVYFILWREGTFMTRNGM